MDTNNEVEGTKPVEVLGPELKETADNPAKEEKMNPKDLIKAPVKMATGALDIMKPVLTRLRNRHTELQELSRAKTTRIDKGKRYIHHTIPPVFNINNLEMHMESGLGKISYEVYKVVNKDNACIHNEWKEGMPKREKHEEVRNDTEGTKWLNERSEPVVEKIVVETIKAGKPIHKEEEVL